jgi:superfamily II DNA helicase RecQ
VREKRMEEWKSGSNSKILVGTTAIGSGIDYPCVGFVVHLGSPRTILDFVQKSGRGGRSILMAYSTVFYWPYSKLHQKLSVDTLGVEEIQEYISKARCRRIGLKVMDSGEAKCCYDQVTVLL